MLIPENERALLALGNVTYSEITKMYENENVLVTHARGTSVHARHDAGFAFHSVAAVGRPFSESVLETAAKPLLLNSTIFEACENMLLMRGVCMFSVFYDS